MPNTLVNNSFMVAVFKSATSLPALGVFDGVIDEVRMSYFSCSKMRNEYAKNDSSNLGLCEPDITFFDLNLKLYKKSLFKLN